MSLERKSRFAPVDFQRGLHDLIPLEAVADIVGGEVAEHADGVGVGDDVAELGLQVVHVPFVEGDAAFVGGHPLVAEHCDLHLIPSLFCDKNLRMQKPII